MDETQKVKLSVCFQLGRALRHSDAEAFLTFYDSLLRDGGVEHDQQLLAVKEWSRQISELSPDDLSLLHTATLSPLNTCDVSIATNGDGAVNVSEQLSCLLERLRMMETAGTSDSGAVSDYSENTDCKSYSLTSLDPDLEDYESYQHSSNYKALVSTKSSGLCEPTHSKISSSSDIQEIITKDVTSLATEEQSLSGTTGQVDRIRKETHSKAISSSVGEEAICIATQTTEVHKSTNQQKEEQVTGESGRQLPSEKTMENRNESVNAEPFRIRRKTKQYYGYSDRRRSYGYYDNSRRRNCNNGSRNGYYDNSGSRGRQHTSSIRDNKQHKCSSFNHEEVAAFLWNRWKSVERNSHHDSISHSKS